MLDTKRGPVTLELVGDLQRHLKKGQAKLVVEIVEGTTIGELVDRLALRPDFFGAMVDGQVVTEDHQLESGMSVLLFSPFGGG